jgi:hypothetical protein
MNYGELKVLVRQFLECDEDTFNANIANFIRFAEEDISRQVQLQDLMETSTASLVPNTPYLGMPEDFLSAYSLSILVNGQWFYLLSKDHSFIRECFPAASQVGVPRYYAMFDDETMMLGPTPDNNYTVELNYYYIPPSLTDGPDSNTTWISEKGENALLYGTIIQGYIYLKGDQDVMKQYMDMYTNSIQMLKVIAEGRNRKDSYRKSDARITV